MMICVGEIIMLGDKQFRVVKVIPAPNAYVPPCGGLPVVFGGQIEVEEIDKSGTLATRADGRTK